MKLYTEEQVRKAIAIGFDWCHNKQIPNDWMVDNFIKDLTPIELPSYEEIECTGNDGNGCFMDSSVHHNCGCVGIQPPNPKQMKQTIQLVEQWAEEKGILSKATPLTQAMKTLEEVNELLGAIMDDNPEEIKDAIGDIMVTLIIQCKMQGMDLQDCLESAYNVIKNRTGKMVGGVFVKD